MHVTLWGQPRPPRLAAVCLAAPSQPFEKWVCGIKQRAAAACPGVRATKGKSCSLAALQDPKEAGQVGEDYFLASKKDFQSLAGDCSGGGFEWPRGVIGRNGGMPIVYVFALSGSRDMSHRI